MSSLIKRIVPTVDQQNVTLKAETDIEVPPGVSLSYKIPV